MTDITDLKRDNALIFNDFQHQLMKRQVNVGTLRIFRLGSTDSSLVTPDIGIYEYLRHIQLMLQELRSDNFTSEDCA